MGFMEWLARKPQINETAISDPAGCKDRGQRKNVVQRFLLAGAALSLVVLAPSASAQSGAASIAAYKLCMADAQTTMAQTVGSPWFSVDYRCISRRNTNPGMLMEWVSQTYQKSGSATYYWGTFHGFSYREDEKVRPEKSAGECPGSCTKVGNPIEISTGNKYQAEQDVAAAGGLEFTRYYNSQLSSLRSASTIGIGWTHTFDRKIEYPVPDGETWVARSHRADGKVLLFYRQPDAAQPWVPSAVTDGDVRERLLQRRDSNGTVIGWRLVAPSSNTYEDYDADGFLVGMQAGTDAMAIGNEVAGTTKRVSWVRSSNGRELTFTYNADGTLLGVTGPDGGQWTYNYNNTGFLSGVSFNGVSTRQYLYAEAAMVTSTTPAWSLTGIVDEAGARYATFRYNALKAKSTEHAGGAETYSLIYDGTYVWINMPNGAQERRALTTLFGVGRVSSIAVSCQNCSAPYTTITYSSTTGALKSKTVNNIQTTFDIDELGFNKKLVEAVGTANQRTVEQDRHANWPVPVEVRTKSANGTLQAKQTYTYNTRGQILTESRIDPVTSVSRTTAMTYCEAADVTNGVCPLEGLLLSVDGPLVGNSDLTTYAYYLSDHASCATTPATCSYRKGDLATVTNALGQVTETSKYDGTGRVLSVKDVNGVTTDMEYSPRGWLTASKVRGLDDAVETDDVITRIEYWPTGLVKRVTQPDGAYTNYVYDQAHRLTDVSDDAGNTIHYTLDGIGNRISEQTKDSGGNLKHSLSRAYNQLNQLKSQTNAQSNSTTFTYDANGNRSTVTDALSRVTGNAYDALSRLSATLQDVGGIEAQTGFQYDALDNLTKVTDPKGLDTTYTYNGLGDLLQLQSPDTGITTYTYDDAGNRKTQTDARGVTSTYTYDVLNRLVGVAYPTASLNVGYVYDTTQAACGLGESYSAGRLTRVNDGSGSTQYCYDRFGRTVRKVQTTNGVTFVVQYAYTKSGQLQAMVYPDGTAVDYVRDSQGRVAEIGVTRTGQLREVLVTQATYYPFGPLARWTYGNGRQMVRTYDKNYRPIAIEDAATGGLSLGFGYDAVGNLTKLGTAQGVAAPAIRFTYDALGRLTQTQDGPTLAAIDSYSYDKTGNRTSHTTAAGTSAYVYPSSNHHLTEVAGVSRTYDALGNTTSIGGTSREYVYDDSGRMNQVNQGGIISMEYAHNGLGEQVSRHAGTSNSIAVHDESGRWLGEFGNNGDPAQQMLWLDDLPVGLLANNGKTFYVEPDALGTPRSVIEAVRNALVWSWDLKGEAFGSTSPNQDPDGDLIPFRLDMRFPGQRYDESTQFNQNGYRDYEAATGRYVESDPTGFWGGISTYSYVSGNPLSFSDPSGLAPNQIGLTPNQVCKASWIATCTVVGGGAGYWVGGVLGGVAGSEVPVAGNAAGFVIGSQLGGMAGASGGGLLGGITADIVCPEDDSGQKCELAKSDARRHYLDLVLKRLPQYTSGGVRGSDGNHYTTILERQKALRRAISRVRLYCKTLPPELVEWEKVANMIVPVLH